MVGVPVRLALIAMLFLAAVAPRGAAAAQRRLSGGPDRAYVTLQSSSLVQDKDCYLLTLLEQLPDVRATLIADPGLADEAKRRRSMLQAAKANCKGEVACSVGAFMWSDAEITSMGDLLAASLERAHLTERLVDRHMRPSGRLQRYADLGDDALIRQARADAAHGMNHILQVYGLGEPPLYPLIDSVSYPFGGKMWKDGVDDMVDVTLQQPPAEHAMFFALPLGAALDVLDMNDRDEPTRLEPLSKGENAAAMAYARTLDWSAWPSGLAPEKWRAAGEERGFPCPRSSSVSRKSLRRRPCVWCARAGGRSGRSPAIWA